MSEPSCAPGRDCKAGMNVIAGLVDNRGKRTALLIITLLYLHFLGRTVDHMEAIEVLHSEIDTSRVNVWIIIHIVIHIAKGYLQTLQQICCICYHTYRQTWSEQPCVSHRQFDIIQMRNCSGNGSQCFQLIWHQVVAAWHPGPGVLRATKYDPSRKCHFRRFRISLNFEYWISYSHYSDELSSLTRNTYIQCNNRQHQSYI